MGVVLPNLTEEFLSNSRQERFPNSVGCVFSFASVEYTMNWYGPVTIPFFFFFFKHKQVVSGFGLGCYTLI